MPSIAKKGLAWVATAFVAYAIFTSPVQAADFTADIWDIAKQSILNLSRFFDNLLGQ